MLYLFLTGNRSAYLDAVFTVLHLPQNTIYDLKYKVVASNSIVDDSESEVKSPKGEKTLILFNNEEGLYVPLRVGVLQKCRIEEGQIYYSVKLTDYCHAKNEQNFCHFIDQAALPKRIRWIKDKSNDMAEGILAFRHVDNENIFSFLERTKDSWIKTVRCLGDAMKDMNIFEQYYLIFTKMEIRAENDDNQLSSKGGRINLKSGEDYTFHMTYYIPEFNKSPMEFIPAEFYQSQDCLGIMNSKVAFFSEQNKVDVVCSPRTNVTENKRITVGFEISKEKANNKIIQYVRTPVEINLKTRMPKIMRHVITISCVILSFIGSALAGIKLEETASNLESMLKILGSTFTTLSTVGMVYLIGKPKL